MRRVKVKGKIRKMWKNLALMRTVLIKLTSGSEKVTFITS